MGSVVAFAVFCAAPGLPLALLLERRTSERADDPDWGTLFYEAALLGLAFHLLAGLVLMRASLFSASALLISAGTATVVAGAAAVRVGVRAPRLPNHRSRWAIAAAVVVLVVAAVLRRHPAVFLFMTGDMGEYTNLAHVIARGEAIVESFPHAFPVFLALGTALFGRAETSAVVPFAGLLVVGGVLALGRELRVPAAARLAVAAIAAVGVLPVWYSVFPASESLYAALVVGVLTLLARAHHTGEVRWAVCAGGLHLLLGLLRGNALLLAPLLVAYLLASALTRSDDGFRVDRAFGIMALGGLGLAFLYNVEWLPTYYVTTQLGFYLPGRVFDGLESVGIFRVGPSLVAALTLAIPGTFATVTGVRRLASRVPDGTERVLPALLLLGTAVAAAAMGAGAVVAGMERLGALLPLAGLAGLGVVAAVHPRARAVLPVAVFAALLVAGFTALHAYRFPDERSAPYFLYWERYLYSEVLPALLAGTLLSVGAAWNWIARHRRPVATASAGLVLAAIPLALLPTTLRATSDELFQGGDRMVAEIDDLAGPHDTPVFYSGWAVPRDEWFYENSFRVFGLPLQISFGRDVVNLPAEPYVSDPSPSAGEIEAWMLEHGVERVALVRFSRPSQPAAVDVRRSNLAAEHLGTVRGDLPVLERRIGGGERWDRYAARLDVFALSLA